MKVLLTGASGQLGQQLIAQKPLNLNKSHIELLALTRNQLDLSNAKACKEIVKRYSPDWIINAGAYTAVDKAESEPLLAYAVNADAPAAFVDSLFEVGGRLLQISTDFVFNGRNKFPYLPNDHIDPLGVYGFTKAEGEVAALRHPGSRVLRTSWLYGPVGKNFCLTMLRLHREKAFSNESLKVVSDQIGCPTATYTLAKACWQTIALEGMAERHRKLHWCDAGFASWHDFAVAIGEIGEQIGLLKAAAAVKPISTFDYPTPAKRPSYSLLDCTSTCNGLGLDQIDWRAALANVLQNCFNPRG